MSIKRRPRFLILLFPMFVSSCIFETGWTDSKKNQLRKEMCTEYGISSKSSQCDCFVRVVIDYFDTPSAFTNSTEAPPGFIERLTRC